MNAFLQAYEAAARFGAVLAINSLWQGAAIAVLTWGVLRVFAKANASTRYAAWLVALLALLMLPLVTSFSHVLVRPGAAAHSTIARRPSFQSEAVTHGVLPLSGTTHRADAGAPLAATPAASRISITLPELAATVTFAVWVLGALALLTRLSAALVHLERLKRESMPLGVERRDALLTWQEASKGARDVRICVCDDIDVPVAVGLFDAMILLPSHLVSALDPQDLDRILVHELAHLLRADDWTNGLQRLASALLFFNPAMWFIAHQLDIEREVACDDRVLELTGAVRPYALCLTKMAEMTALPHRPLAAPGVFMTRKNISIRVERLLTAGRAFGSSIAPAILGTVTVGLTLLVLLLRTVAPSYAYDVDTNSAPQPHALAMQAHAKPAAHASAHAKASPTATPEVRIASAAMPHSTAQPSPNPPVRKASPAHAAVPPVRVTVRPVRVAVPMFGGRDIAGIVSEVTTAALASMTYSVGTATKGGCTGCDYSHTSHPGADFHGQSFTGTDFSHARLKGANFSDASLMGTDFEGADLRNVSFAGARLDGCNLRGADISGARFERAHMDGCSIDAKSLAPGQARAMLASCTGCDFSRVDLKGMDLRNLHIMGATLASADLRNADLSDASLTGVDLANARLTGARLDGTHFIGCNFNGVDLRGVDLSKASIVGSSMRNANLHL